MRIGIDFDNTIVSYDALFHRVALERELVPPELPVSKLSVRQHLRLADQEDLWTELQGYVYGARMDEAVMYPGALEFFRWARAARVEVLIVSHKTRHPFAGPRYDLHAAARAWVASHLRDDEGDLIDPQAVHFEPTKETKVACIARTGCTHFIDDLPEILFFPGFPTSTQRILFDPEDHHVGETALHRVRHWPQFQDYCSSLWAKHR